jgi:hypothetical protein
MRSKRNVLLVCCLLGTLWGCAQQPEVEQEANITADVAELLPDQPTDPAIVVAAPEMAHTVFSNDWIRVARVTLPQDELIPPHTGGTRYVYPLSDCTLNVDNNGTEETVHLVPGELATWAAGRLGLANVDETSADLVVVERTPIESSPDLEVLATPDLAIDMEQNGSILLDDDNVLAVDVHLTPGAGDPLPPNLPMLLVALSDSHLELEGADATKVDVELGNGEAFWQDAGCGSVMNIGGGEAHLLVLALRK